MLLYKKNKLPVSYTSIWQETNKKTRRVHRESIHETPPESQHSTIALAVEYHWPMRNLMRLGLVERLKLTKKS